MLAASMGPGSPMAHAGNIASQYQHYPTPQYPQQFPQGYQPPSTPTANDPSSFQNFGAQFQQQPYGQFPGAATYSNGPLTPQAGNVANMTGQYPPFSQLGGDGDVNRTLQFPNPAAAPQHAFASSDYLQSEDACFSNPNEMPRPGYGSCSLLGMRPVNEDRTICLPRLDVRISDVACFGVFDGHGGAHAADHCVEFMPKYLASQIQSNSTNFNASNADKFLIECFREADNEYIRQAAALGYAANDTTNLQYHMENKTIASAGTTACMVILVGKKILCANAGDSRAILYNSVTDTTNDLSAVHKPSEPSEQARIHAAGGQVTMNNGCARVNNILATSRGIGDLYLKSVVIADPEIRVKDIGQGDDFVIIASDGLWDVFSPGEACTLALQAGDSRNAAKTLAEAAVQKGSDDNTTVIVVDLRVLQLFSPQQVAPPLLHVENNLRSPRGVAQYQVHDFPHQVDQQSGDHNNFRDSQLQENESSAATASTPLSRSGSPVTPRKRYSGKTERSCVCM